MKQYLFLSIVTISFSYSHDLDKENLDWRQYYRLGSVYSESSDIGHSWYGRLKRTTSFTFRDVRFFGHFYKSDSEIRLRHKYSRRFLSIDNIYSYSTLLYERNTSLNVDLRYHLNQGLGYLLRSENNGNMTIELGVAFDNSDYLNAEQKTTYLRGACSIDHRLKSFSGKFEVDYFYQISEVELRSSLSRFQVVSEFEWLINKSFGIISGFTWDIQDENSSPSTFLTISITRPINWYF